MPPDNTPARLDRIAGVGDWQVEDETLIVSLETESRKTAVLKFRAEYPEIWRVTFFPHGQPTGQPSDHRDPVVARPVLTPVSLQVEKSNGGLRVSGPELNLEIAFRPLSIRFVDASGAEIFGENPSDIDGLGRPVVPSLGFVEQKGTISRISESFRLHPGEHLFGLGEKFTRLNKSGQGLISWTQDALGSTSERSHKNIPFLWSSRGYGLFIDSSARVVWDLGTTSCLSATISVEDRILDFYLIFGPTPAKILERYATLTGRAPVPPKWTFGLWLSSGGTYRTQEDIGKLIHGLDVHEFPADVVHIDTWWMRERKYCDFQWKSESFPRPDALIESLHRRGLKLSLWEHPYISVESELFAVGREKGYFVRRPDGEVYVVDYGLSLAPRPDGRVRQADEDDSWNARATIVDFTNQEAAAWYKELHRPALRMGADVFKTDFGENIPEDAVFHNGQTGATMHNLYPLLYNRAVFEITQEEKGYGAVWARSAFAGSQQYPLVWSGDPAADFASLACTIRGGLSAGMSGLPFWSNDIGGYRGTPSAELYVRWAQFGLFCSHSRMHGDGPREPWHFGEEALEIVRRYAHLRYELFPYLYSTALEAVFEGLPVIRALPIAFPDDPNGYDKDFEFMFGPWILVAPVIEPGGKCTLYLPEGEWFDFWTGRAHLGPKTLKFQAALDLLPIYIRGGAIIPKMQRAWRIPEERISPLIVEVWPWGMSSYQFYEDEGVTEFRCSSVPKKLDFEWSGPLHRQVILHFRGIKKPGKVELTTPEEPDKIYEMKGMALKKTYVLAVPETAAAKVKLSF